MNKNFLPTALLCAALIPSAAFAADEHTDFNPGDTPNDSIVLNLRAGEPAMIINGDAQEITAPFVTDDNVTLVPLRVITETFGAQVDWNADEQEITLVYEDVSLTLRIGSRAAAFGNHTETLESAPVIVDDVTMVPLRFIAETFGAEVDFDEETGIITVTLSDFEESEMLRAMHEKPYIGNSYYSWSMQTPVNMELMHSSTDGKSLTFADDNYNILSISIEEEKEAIDPDEYFNEGIVDMLGSIVSVAEKTPRPDGSTVIHFRTAEYGDEEDVHVIIKGKRAYTIMTGTLSYMSPDEEQDKSSIKDLYALIDTFSLTVRDDMYDFSNRSDDGKYTYKNDDYKLTMTLPDTLIEEKYSYDTADNILEFYSDDEEIYQVMSISVYSKTDELNMQSSANRRHETDKDIFDPNTVTVGDIEEIEVNGTSGYSYKVSSSSTPIIGVKTYFEVGDYVYSVVINSEDEQGCYEIIDSIAAEELGPEETGTMLDLTGMLSGYTFKAYSYSVELPSYWYGEYSSIKDLRTDSSIYCSVVSEDMTEYIDNLKSNEDYRILKDLSWNGDICTMEIASDNEVGMNSRISIRGKRMGKQIYVFRFTRGEQYIGGKLDAEFEAIVNSVKKINK